MALNAICVEITKLNHAITINKSTAAVINVCEHNYCMTLVPGYCMALHMLDNVLTTCITVCMEFYPKETMCISEDS